MISIWRMRLNKTSSKLGQIQKRVEAEKQLIGMSEERQSQLIPAMNQK
jgi:hypothetical protein